MDFKLTIEEYNELRRLQKKANLHPRRYRKVTVLIMLHQGHSISTIEAALGLDDNTIRRYVDGYNKRGLRNFLKDGFIPYVGQLDEIQKEQLVNHLDEYLYEDAKSICAYVQETFGVKYSTSGMTKLLHRLGFVYKKTKKVPSKADDEAQRQFIEEDLVPVLEQVKQGEAVLYFADGCHPTHNTKSGSGWIRSGQDFEVDCNSGRKRVNINAATNAIKPEHIVYDITRSVNAQSTQRLIQKLLKKHPSKTIYLVCDNARYYKNRMLREWLENKRVELVFLPPYSPNLNIIERYWRFMRKKAINSIYYDTYDKFRAAIIDFLNSSKIYKTQLRSLLTLNFRTVGGCSMSAQTTFR